MHNSLPFLTSNSQYTPLRSTIVKQQYLLQLKAKYAGTQTFTLQDITARLKYWCTNAQIVHSHNHFFFCIDGQKNAKRLSTGITKETASVRKLLSDFNTTRSLVDDNSTPVTLKEVLSPDADFWQSPVPHAPYMSLSHDLSWNTKKDITFS